MPQRVVILATTAAQIRELTAWCHRHGAEVVGIARDARSALAMLCDQAADRLLIPHEDLWRDLLPLVRVLGQSPAPERPHRLR